MTPASNAGTRISAASTTEPGRAPLAGDRADHEPQPSRRTGHGSVQPGVPACAANESAARSAAGIAASSSVPDGSMRLSGSRCVLLGRRNHPSARPISPTGMFTRKISRQPPRPVRMPPSAGPTQSPTACAAPWIPRPVPSRDGGSTSRMSAYEFACSITAPAAWTRRASTSSPSDGAMRAGRGADDEDAESVRVQQLPSDSIGDLAHCRNAFPRARARRRAPPIRHLRWMRVG